MTVKGLINVPAGDHQELLAKAKQYKCHHCCSCKKYRGKGMEGGKKEVFLRRFLADQKIAISWKKMRFGASYSTSNKLLLVAGHILTTGLQKCLL